jgi:hypothetical protein
MHSAMLGAGNKVFFQLIYSGGARVLRRPYRNLRKPEPVRRRRATIGERKLSAGTYWTNLALDGHRQRPDQASDYEYKSFIYKDFLVLTEGVVTAFGSYPIE